MLGSPSTPAAGTLRTRSQDSSRVGRRGVEVEMVERLSALDASFLYLENSNVHMHVAGLSILDPSTAPGGRLGFDDLAGLIAARIHMVPRFRQKVAFVPFRVAGPAWVDDPGFDVSFHLRRASCAGGR